jgi:hypothetical protein
MTSRYPSLILLLLLAVSGLSDLKAQSTLEDVTAILNTSCTFSSCHDASTPAAGLDLSGTTSDIAANLVNQDPINPNALSKGYKLIDPGTPENSFLLRKIADPTWDDWYPNDLADGDPMPPAGYINHEDIELIRQWINFGAPSSGQVVDPQVLEDYYVNGMGMAKVEAPAPPPEGEGFQVRIGSFFLAPGQEKEFFNKKAINFPDSTEGIRTNLFFNDESHHFILYKFEPASSADLFADGYREVAEPGASPDENISIVAAWQDAYDIALPDGSAYFWGTEEVLDLNYHIINTSDDSVMACDAYINIYTRPRDASQPTVQMFSTLIPINAFEEITGTGWIGQDLVIPGDGAEYTFEDEIFFPFVDPPTWYLWYLSSHTHARGTDYDIYKRANGEQIFEGFYNVDYTFNQGFYDWEHPPVRFFDPLLPIDMGIFGGITHEAKYINNTGSTMYWGDRTTDEMMLFFIQFTEKPLPDLTSLAESDVLEDRMLVGPNPFVERTFVDFDLASAASDVRIEVYDAAGRLIEVMFDGALPAGAHRFEFKAGENPAGVYTLRLQADGQYGSKQMIRVE